MKIHVAGGKGEHGRNCFCIDDGTNTFLLDCGIKSDDKNSPYPFLSYDEIKRLKVIFLSHSHADHTGALNWLYQKGFKGFVAATSQTFYNVSTEIQNKILLKDWHNLQKDERFGISIEFGRSGHCLGSVWLKLTFENQKKTIFYSGDYTENTKLYAIDKIRNQNADFAIIDTAYGTKHFDYKIKCYILLQHIQLSLEQNKIICLPVPKNGRATEILYFLNKKLPLKYQKFYSDEYLFNNLLFQSNKKDKYWFKHKYKKIFKNILPLSQKLDIQTGIVFLSNPQLNDKKSLIIAKKILKKQGLIIFTGTIEKYTPAYKLYTSKKAEKHIYPVHQTKKEYAKLISKNNFQKSISFHTADDKNPERIFEF